LKFVFSILSQELDRVLASYKKFGKIGNTIKNRKINIMEKSDKPNKPPDDDFTQQKLKAWQPIMTPLKVVVIFLVIGIAFIPTGTTILNASDDVNLNLAIEFQIIYFCSNFFCFYYKKIYQSRIRYDEGSCSINNQNEGKECSVSILLISRILILNLGFIYL
jgi:hypothetical protein